MILKIILYFRFCFQTKGFSFPAKSIIKEFLKIHLLFILLLPESCSPCVISVINIFLDFQLIIVKCFTAMFFLVSMVTIVECLYTWMKLMHPIKYLTYDKWSVLSRIRSRRLFQGTSECNHVNTMVVLSPYDGFIC